MHSTLTFLRCCSIRIQIDQLVASFKKKNFALFHLFSCERWKTFQMDMRMHFRLFKSDVITKFGWKKKRWKRFFVSHAIIFYSRFFFLQNYVYRLATLKLEFYRVFFSKESLIINIKLNCILLEFGAFSHGSRHFCLDCTNFHKSVILILERPTLVLTLAKSGWGGGETQ